MTCSSKKKKTHQRKNRTMVLPPPPLQATQPRAGMFFQLPTCSSPVPKGCSERKLKERQARCNPLQGPRMEEGCGGDIISHSGCPLVPLQCGTTGKGGRPLDAGCLPCSTSHQLRDVARLRGKEEGRACGAMFGTRGRFVAWSGVVLAVNGRQVNPHGPGWC